MSSKPAAIHASLWRNRSLWWQFTKRQVELRHKGSHLGLVWSFLSPLLMLGLYVLVFGFIFDGRFKPLTEAESRIEYALVVFLGLALHHFLAEVITTAPATVTSNPNFVKKVVFPLDILPAANAGAALVHFFITFCLLILGALVSGLGISVGLLWVPVILLPVLVIALGFSLGLSALGVFWRDVNQVTQFASLALLFASAVFYPVSKIPPEAWAVLKFNPLLLAIDEARKVTFWANPPNLVHVGYLYACALLAYVTGCYLFQRLRSSFADVL